MANKDIATRLIEMESRLKEIISVTEDLKLRSEEGEAQSKQQRLDARTLHRKTEFENVSPEIRLKRFLYIGDETPLFTPGTLESKLSSSKVNSVQQLVHKYQWLREKEEKEEKEKEEKEKGEEKNEKEKGEEKEGKKKCKSKLPKHTEEDIPVLVMISKALNDPLNPNIECAIFALALVIRCDITKPEVKEAAYNVARRYLDTYNKLTLFIKYSTMLNRETKTKPNSGGWGGGMRRLVVQWYNKQDDRVVLARTVAHHSKEHLWSHKDLFKLSHLKPSKDDVAMQAIVCYVLYGLPKTEEKFGNEENAAKVIEEFRKRQEELQADTEKLCQLIESRKLKHQDIKTDRLKTSPKVWCAVLKNMSPDEILTLMPSIMWLRFQIDQSPITEKDNKLYKAAVEARKKEERKAGDEVRKLACELLLKDGVKLPPAQVYITLKNYLKSLKDKGFIFNSPYLLDIKLKETFTPVEPCPTSVTTLETLLANSLKAQETGVRVLVTVDLRPTEDSDTCQWTHSVLPLEAAALVAMHLVRSNKICVLAMFTEGKELQRISVSKTMTVDALIAKFKEVQLTAKKEPKISEPLEWAKERKHDYDVFVVLTPSLKSWKWEKGHDVAKVLQEYRDSKEKPGARLAVCAFGNMTMFVSTNKSDGMLDLAGFHANTIPVLNSFCQGSF